MIRRLDYISIFVVFIICCFICIAYFFNNTTILVICLAWNSAIWICWADFLTEVIIFMSCYFSTIIRCFGYISIFIIFCFCNKSCCLIRRLDDLIKTIIFFNSDLTDLVCFCNTPVFIIRFDFYRCIIDCCLSYITKLVIFKFRCIFIGINRFDLLTLVIVFISCNISKFINILNQNTVDVINLSFAVSFSINRFCFIVHCIIFMLCNIA